MTSTIGIIITFIILGSLLLYNLIYTSLHWLLKFIAITITIYFSLITFFSLEDLKGWPVETALPRAFIILAVNVQEPVNHEDKGGIYLWCKDLTQYSTEDNNIIFSTLKPFYDFKKPINKPRNYEFKYNKNLHEKLSEVEELIKQGKMIFGENKGIKSNNNGESKKDKASNGGKSYDHREFEYELKFYELPPPKLPEKVTQ